MSSRQSRPTQSERHSPRSGTRRQPRHEIYRNMTPAQRRAERLEEEAREARAERFSMTPAQRRAERLEEEAREARAERLFMQRRAEEAREAREEILFRAFERLNMHEMEIQQHEYSTNWTIPPEYDSNEKCTICLEPLSGEVFSHKQYNIYHNFHKSCIDQWFSTAGKCPTCRQNFGRKIIL